MSEIDFESINENFPANGRDNSTQGFRDNFTTIKNNFQFAKTEIEALAGTSITTSQNNNFNGNSIINANLSQTSEQASVIGLNGIIANSNISYLFGHLHALVVKNNITLTFTDWPTKSNYAKIRVVLFGDDTARTVVFATQNGSIKKKTDFPSTLTVTSSDNPKIIDAWTYDKGVTVYLDYVGEYV